MFKPGLDESRDGVVKIDDLSGLVLRRLLEYAYAGKFEDNESDDIELVSSLLVAAVNSNYYYLHLLNLSKYLFTMDQDSLKIFQWNCHSLCNKIGDLRQIINDYDVLLLNETWLNDNYTIKFPNHHIIRKDRQNSPHGGVAIIINNNIPFQSVDNIFHKENSIETIGITIPVNITNNDTEQLLIISL